MTDVLITIHKSKTDAEFWASQLSYVGKILLEIKGPYKVVVVEDQTTSRMANMASGNSGDCWIVLAGNVEPA